MAKTHSTVPAATSSPRHFKTTSPKGLDYRHPAMRLWQKAKRFGTWNPTDIDFSRDREDWLRFTDRERDGIFRLTSVFQAGEESVARDILPLIQAISDEGRLEEEMFLASFFWEEAKHVEVFRCFIDQVTQDDRDLSCYHPPSYRHIFEEALPNALNRLRTDPSPVAQAEASITYNMIVEGVLAETGYHAYETALKRYKVMPGMRQAVTLVKRDESRHIAYGVYLLTRLIEEHGEPIWDAIQQKMSELLLPASASVYELFDGYGDDIPFGLQIDEFVNYAISQFEKRLARIEKARKLHTRKLAV